jgi:hypothetical protein
MNSITVQPVITRAEMTYTPYMKKIFENHPDLSLFWNVGRTSFTCAERQNLKACSSRINSQTLKKDRYEDVVNAIGLLSIHSQRPPILEYTSGFLTQKIEDLFVQDYQNFWCHTEWNIVFTKHFVTAVSFPLITLTKNNVGLPSHQDYTQKHGKNDIPPCDNVWPMFSLGNSANGHASLQMLQAAKIVAENLNHLNTQAGVSITLKTPIF